MKNDAVNGNEEPKIVRELRAAGWVDREQGDGLTIEMPKMIDRCAETWLAPAHENVTRTHLQLISEVDGLYSLQLLQESQIQGEDDSTSVVTLGFVHVAQLAITVGIFLSDLVFRGEKINEKNSKQTKTGE